MRNTQHTHILVSQQPVLMAGEMGCAVIAPLLFLSFLCARSLSLDCLHGFFFSACTLFYCLPICHPIQKNRNHNLCTRQWIVDSYLKCINTAQRTYPVIFATSNWYIELAAVWRLAIDGLWWHAPVGQTPNGKWNISDGQIYVQIQLKSRDKCRWPIQFFVHCCYYYYYY